jgi:hypothetical protein
VFPAQTAGVRQRLVDQTPVLETIFRVGGGEIIHRCYAARSSDEYAVIEIENASPTPVAIGMAVRPYDLTGAGRVSQISLVENTVVVDGVQAFAANRPPGQLIVGAGGIDAAANLSVELVGEEAVSEVTCAAGRANAVAVYPLVHSTTLRIALPITPGAPMDSSAIDRLPEAARVVRGWRFVTERATRVVFPAGRLDEGFDAARRQLLLHHLGDDVAATPLGGGTPVGADETILAGLSALGHHDEVRQVLIGRGQMQNPRGAVLDDDERDLTGTTLAAAGRHLTLNVDADLAEALSEFAADGARWLFAANPADPWNAVGIEGARLVLLAGGHVQAASDLEAARAERAAEANLPWSQTLALAGYGQSGAPAGALERDWQTEDVGVHRGEGPMGFDPVFTAALALSEMALSEMALSEMALSEMALSEMALSEIADCGRAARTIEWLLEQASPTWAWPTALHPKLGTGTAGVGQDGRVTAAFVQLVMTLLVSARRVDRESERPTVEIARHWFPAWVGQGIEVHDAPSPVGVVSWAVRWHGDRPALLWEIEPQHPSGPAPVITAPGLDAGFLGETWTGEALLEPWTEPGTESEAASVEAPTPPPAGGISFS